MNTIVALALLGLATGALSGMLGIGGGLIVIPVLTLLFGFTQKEAQGTSLLMMLPPVGLFAVLAYHKAGNVDVKAGLVLAATFAAGALVTAYLINFQWISDDLLRRVFAFFIMYAACNLLFRNDHVAWAALKTLAVVGALGAAYLVLRGLGRKWDRQISAAEVYRRQRGSGT